MTVLNRTKNACSTRVFCHQLHQRTVLNSGVPQLKKLNKDDSETIAQRIRPLVGGQNVSLAEAVRSQHGKVPYLERLKFETTTSVLRSMQSEQPNGKLHWKLISSQINSRDIPESFPILSIAIPQSFQNHSRAIPEPFQCHFMTIPGSFQGHSFAILVPFQCHSSTIPLQF